MLTVLVSTSCPCWQCWCLGQCGFHLTRLAEPLPQDREFDKPLVVHSCMHHWPSEGRIDLLPAKRFDSTTMYNNGNIKIYIASKFLQWPHQACFLVTKPDQLDTQLGTCIALGDGRSGHCIRFNLASLALKSQQLSNYCTRTAVVGTNTSEDTAYCEDHDVAKLVITSS